MRRTGWWTRGAATPGAVVIVPQSPQWVWLHNGRRVRVYPHRIRGEYWVEPGHIETDDPATDTREG